jgi:hypothetical protein
VWLFPNFIRQIKSRKLRWAGYVANMGDERKLYKVLAGKPEGKRPFRRPKCRWVDGIRMDIKGIVWEGVVWIQLAQDRDLRGAVVNTVMNFRILVSHLVSNVSC